MFGSVLSSLRRYQSTAIAFTAAITAAASLTGIIVSIAAASGSEPAAASRPIPPSQPSLTSYSLPDHATAPPVAAARRGTYHIVVHGDTLSAISQEEYSRPACWPGIYRANESTIGANPDVIDAGWRLAIPASCDTRPVYTPAAQPVTTAYVQHDASSTATHGSEDAISAASASSSFEACVITRESGGNAQIFNASGHYGLFQFSYSTWVAAGGSPSLFGHASAAYQEQVFWKAYGLWGTSPWQPYDGCA
jgi:LysM repeat protein